MFHICKGPLLASPSVSEIPFLTSLWASIDGKGGLGLAAEGLVWGEVACMTALQAHLFPELQSQLKFRDVQS